VKAQIGCRIAIVDDGPVYEAYKKTVCLGISRVLSQYYTETLLVDCHKVTREAPSWDRVIEEILSDPPDIVFVDEQMDKKGDGIEFIRVLRSRDFCGYTYLHTSIDSELILADTINSNFQVLGGHGTGAVRKGREEDVIKILSRHLQAGKDNGLQTFRVANPRVFIEQTVTAREAGTSLFPSSYPANSQSNGEPVVVDPETEQTLRGLKEMYERLYSRLVAAIKSLEETGPKTLDDFLTGGDWTAFAEMVQDLRKKHRREGALVGDIKDVYTQVGNIASFRRWRTNNLGPSANEVESAVNYYNKCADVLLGKLGLLTGPHKS
jgi:hypothetical protein